MDSTSSNEPNKLGSIPKKVSDLTEAHELVDLYISQFKEGYFPPLSNLSRLMEELGELSRELNHRFGGKTKQDPLAADRTREEMGDIFFTLLVLANQLEIDLGEALSEVLKKYQRRDFSRWTPLP
ncbi:nucleotide pyrophosphohydrolase [bacterium]|jgi:NTP pyrophosphatase (non-canonical NTP hydrolase)|nr:nucleotide pyrophosphohydrolase [bacterium]